MAYMHEHDSFDDWFKESHGFTPRRHEAHRRDRWYDRERDWFARRAEGTRIGRESMRSESGRESAQQEDDIDLGETEEYLYTETHHYTDPNRHDYEISDDESFTPRQFRRQNSHRHRENSFDDAYYDSEPDEVTRSFSSRDHVHHRRSASQVRSHYHHFPDDHVHWSRPQSDHGPTSRSSNYDIHRRVNEQLKYDEGSYQQTWREDTVVFEKNEAIMNPTVWRGKLLSLQAQVLDRSSFREFRQLMRPVHTYQFYAHLEGYQAMFEGARRSLSMLQYAKACRETFNILVRDSHRAQVARLVRIGVAGLASLSGGFSELLDERRPSTLEAARSLLEQAIQLLSRLGLDTPAFSDIYRHHPIYSGSMGWFAHVPQPERLRLLLLYACRAVAFVLEFAVISFSGAHIEPFDNFYPDGDRYHYRIQCDDRGGHIELKRYELDCLDGFLGGKDAWVFSMSNGEGHDHLEGPLYLSCTPEDFAEVWGPMWRSLVPGDYRFLERYIVIPGYIIPWDPLHCRVRLEEDEILCHWSNDIGEIESPKALSVPANPKRLLIGARPRLLKDPKCTNDYDGLEFYQSMEDSAGVQIVKVPGAEAAKKMTSLDNFQMGASFGLPSVVTLTTNFEFKVSTMGGRDPGDVICTAMAVNPEENLKCLSRFYGVEISACTGNARRVPLTKLLSSLTMADLIGKSPRWPTENNRIRYFDTLRSGNIDDIENLLRRSPASLTALRRSFAFLLGYRVLGKSILALWSYDGKGFGIRLSKSQYQWASLLTDDTDYPSMIIVNSSCLQCADQIIPENSPYQRGEGIFAEHRPYEALSLNMSSVLETTICLKSSALPPKGLTQMPKGPGFVSPWVVTRLEHGAKFYLSNHRRLEVVRVLENGEGVFVRFVTTALPGVKDWATKMASMFKNGSRNAYQTAWEYQDPKLQERRPKLRVFVMSNRHEIAEWFPIRIPSSARRKRRPA